MRSQLCTIFLALTLNAAALPAALSAPASVQSALNSAYAAQNKAAEDKNIEGFMNTLAPDFTGKTPQGQSLNRAQVRQSMTTLFANATHLSGQTTIQTVTVKGDKAYLTVKEHDVLVATNPRNQQIMTIVDDDVDADVWRNVNGTWKELSESVDSEQETRHAGTPLNGGKAETT